MAIPLGLTPGRPIQGGLGDLLSTLAGHQIVTAEPACAGGMQSLLGAIFAGLRSLLPFLD